MEISAAIKQGSRTVLEYLLSPVQQVTSEAGKKPIAHWRRQGKHVGSAQAASLGNCVDCSLCGQYWSWVSP
jgi:formate hydrogenlyase subunit 6/NADH:ubiquinone oxidoreductase subunit I